MSEWQDTLFGRAGNVKYKKDGRDYLVLTEVELDCYTTVSDMRRELRSVERELGPDAMVRATDYGISVTGTRRPTDDERQKIAKHVERLGKKRADSAARKKERDEKVMERLRREYPGSFAD